MIRWGGETKDGKRVIGFALAPENLRRLEAGEPIYVDGVTCGTPGVVVAIVAGKTAERAIEDLQEQAKKAGIPVESLEGQIRKAGFGPGDAGGGG